MTNGRMKVGLDGVEENGWKFDAPVPVLEKITVEHRGETCPIGHDVTRVSIRRV